MTTRLQVNSIIRFVKSWYVDFIEFNKVRYRVLSIHFDSQLAELQVKGKAIVFKKTFSALVTESTIMDYLSAEHACWLGFYYGRALRASVEGRERLRASKRKLSYLLLGKARQYRIIYEDRSGEIGYVDSRTSKKFVEYPIEILRNEYVINKFSPTDACYIGLLLGLAFERLQSKYMEKKPQDIFQMMRARPSLKVV